MGFKVGDVVRVTARALIQVKRGQIGVVIRPAHVNMWGVRMFDDPEHLYALYAGELEKVDDV